MEATYRSFANGKICSDKNYMDVIFITSPGYCFMSREDFPKKHHLERPPKRFPSFKASNNEPSFARFKHPTPIKSHEECFTIRMTF